jgi:hypothetical protein
MISASHRLLALTLAGAFLLAPSITSAETKDAKAAPVSKSKTSKKDDHDHKHGEKESKGHSHHHEAPNGGTLIAIGDHFAHVELVLNKEEGRLTAYVLDGGAEKPVRLKQESLVIEAVIPKEGGATTETLTLRPVSSVLTGEKVGDTSQFEFGFPALKGVEKFEGTLLNTTIKGKTTDKVAFKFPEGNE